MRKQVLSRKLSSKRTPNPPGPLLAKLLSHERARQRVASSSRRLTRKAWGETLGLLSGFVGLCQSAGASVLDDQAAVAAAEQDPTFYALMHLHAASCLTSSEILALLETGHAAGALARWRSLHEMAVYAAFLRKHGPETAERYVRHRHIKDHEDSAPLDKLLAANGGVPFSEPEKRTISDLREKLRGRYGEDFHGGFGWAKKALGKTGRVSFEDLQESAGLSNMEFFYRVASHQVHPTWKGIFDNPGRPPGAGDELLLAVPTPYGLWLPAMLTARSSYAATIAFATCRGSCVLEPLLAELRDAVELVSDHLRHTRDSLGVEAGQI